MLFAMFLLPVAGACLKVAANYKVQKRIQKDLETKRMVTYGCQGQLNTVEELQEMQTTTDGERVRVLIALGEQRWQALRQRTRAGDFTKKDLQDSGIGVCTCCWNITDPDMPH